MPTHRTCPVCGQSLTANDLDGTTGWLVCPGCNLRVYGGSGIHAAEVGTATRTAGQATARSATADEHITSQPRDHPRAEARRLDPDERVADRPSVAAPPHGEPGRKAPGSEYRRVLDFLKYQGGVTPLTAEEERILAGLEAEGLARKEGNVYFYAGDGGSKKVEGRAIGGWLILPAIGLVVSPFTVAWSACQSYTALDNPLLAALPGLRSVIVAELVVNVVMLVFTVYVAVAFFRRKRAVPLLMIALVAVGAVFALADRWAVAVFLPTRADAAALGMLGPLGKAAIWIPYFLLSKRVMETFVE
jgi:hypothetical protein